MSAHVMLISVVLCCAGCDVQACALVKSEAGGVLARVVTALDARDTNLPLKCVLPVSEDQENIDPQRPQQAEAQAHAQSQSQSHPSVLSNVRGILSCLG